MFHSVSGLIKSIKSEHSSDLWRKIVEKPHHSAWLFYFIKYWHA